MKTLFRCLLWGAAAAMAAFAARENRIRHQFRPRDIPVLMYHDVLPAGEVRNAWQVSPEEFARQMDDLDRAGFTPILPGDIARASRGRGRLPRKPVVITFDDGYAGVMQNAEPILRRHGFKAICYVVVRWLGAGGNPRFLTADEAAAMDARGTVAVGLHSVWHRPDPERLAQDVYEARDALFEATGIRSDDYCHPYGFWRSPSIRRALEESGFRTAMACEDRLFRYRPDADLLTIPRLSVYGGPHAIRVEAVDREAGTVTVANDGEPIPLKAVVRSASGTAETGTRGVGGRHPVRTLRVPGGIPADAEIELRDREGLFRYDPVP